MSNYREVINGYHRAVQRVLDAGEPNGADSQSATRHITNATVTFDTSQFWNTRYETCIMLPTYRGAAQSSVRYFLRELAWYGMKTRNVEPIAKYAKIWKTMTDDAGLVNSNYGYQLFANNDIALFVEQLNVAVEKRREFDRTLWIANRANSTARRDTVCNNAIRVTLEHADVNNPEQRPACITMTVFARSIDLLYGLPYDSAMAQWLGQWLCKQTGVKLKHVAFIIADMHIYHRDVETLQLVDELKRVTMVPFEMPLAHPDDVTTEHAACATTTYYCDSAYIRPQVRQLVQVVAPADAEHRQCAQQHVDDPTDRKTFVVDRLNGRITYYASVTRYAADVEGHRVELIDSGSVIEMTCRVEG